MFRVYEHEISVHGYVHVRNTVVEHCTSHRLTILFIQQCIQLCLNIPFKFNQSEMKVFSFALILVIKNNDNYIRGGVYTSEVKFICESLQLIEYIKHCIVNMSFNFK